MRCFNLVLIREEGLKPALIYEMNIASRAYLGRDNLAKPLCVGRMAILISLALGKGYYPAPVHYLHWDKRAVRSQRGNPQSPFGPWAM